MLRLKTLAILVCVFSIHPIFAQEVGDTITVNTFGYNSLTRDTTITFPDFSGLTFEKILMTYNIRCHGGGVNNTGGNNNGPNGSNACGEWDYSCNTYLHDESKTDSIKASHPSFIISGFDGDTYSYTSEPTFTYYQSTQEEVVINSVISETTALLGDGDIPTPYPLENETGHSKTQYLITADELTTGGLTAGDITGLTVDVDQPGVEVNNLRIRMKSTALETFDVSQPELEGFQTVYYLNTSFDNSGIHQFNFSSTFEWDGISNMIVEFSFEDAEGAGSDLLSTLAEGMGISSSATDFSIEFSGTEYVEIDEPIENVTDEITISFWAYGNLDALPANTSAVEGIGENDERQINIHLPWSNGRVYWDCGNDGTGYDRIDKLANTDEIGGRWNHWAFAKSTGSGIMKIYLNGEIWHSGNGFTRPIDIENLKIGANFNGGNGYYGNIDEFRVWNT